MSLGNSTRIATFISRPGFQVTGQAAAEDNARILDFRRHPAAVNKLAPSEQIQADDIDSAGAGQNFFELPGARFFKTARQQNGRGRPCWPGDWSSTAGSGDQVFADKLRTGQGHIDRPQSRASVISRKLPRTESPTISAPPMTASPDDHPQSHGQIRAPSETAACSEVAASRETWETVRSSECGSSE